MQHGIHFISGLPRSGSTLLAALLRQNPVVSAEMSSPLLPIYLAAHTAMSGRNEFSGFITDQQRRSVLRSIVEGFYEANGKLIFDMHRGWCLTLSSVLQLFPKAKVICCVRSVLWILDSFERLVQRNAFRSSRIFNYEMGGSVYSRTARLTAPGGAFTSAYEGFKQAFYGDYADRLLVINYETLTTEPNSTLREIYRFLELPEYLHDTENVEYSADEFDEGVGLEGLHRVQGRVEYRPRQTILPPDIVAKYVAPEFWKESNQNLKNVKIL